MPGNKYINLLIDGRKVDLESLEKLPISISYKLEDSEDFQKKKSSEAFSISIPATTNNDRIANTFHNPGVEDLTPGRSFRSFRSGLIEANGVELLVGKALLTNARHGSRPVSYEFDMYGDNADWLIDLKEATLFDFLKHINFFFTKENIIASWAYDGTNEDLPYVFAPVRYGLPFDDYVPLVGDRVKDNNVAPETMKPCLSKYWIIYWAFKSLGYRISSDFFDSEFFRRQVMPWTWGNFLFSEGTRLNTLDFLAKSTETVAMLNQDFTGFWDLKVTNDSTNGAFDNNNAYSYDTPEKEMIWEYLPAFSYGTLDGIFHLNMAVDAKVTANSDIELRAKWFKNGVHIPHDNDNGNGNLLVGLNGPTVGPDSFIGQVDDFLTIQVSPGDVISCKIYLHTFDSGFGYARIYASVDAFELEYFRIPLGGTIDFEAYSAFKKHKFLDFLRGVIDEFNLNISTDSTSKVVYMEPLHDYSINEDLTDKDGGYLNGNFLDWSEKQDNSKESDLPLFCDSDRELLFKYKDDSSDGLIKVVQDRYANQLSMGKYVFPDRFKAGQKEMQNRFFAATMHAEFDQWKGLGSNPDAKPQIVCLVPENISNTSREEAQNTFEPKSCYYKGLVDHVGWIFDNEVQNNYPFLFAVNYQPGGEDDPILSYCDERISTGIGSGAEPVIGWGLLRRFFLQRMAIMSNGQYYNTWFKLKNIDVANYLHREHIVCRGQKWELVEIKDYKPLSDDSTECSLRKWAPITREDSDNVFPSQDNVLGIDPGTGAFDIKYARLICLSSDLQITNE